MIDPCRRDIAHADELCRSDPSVPGDYSVRNPKKVQLDLGDRMRIHIPKARRKSRHLIDFSSKVLAVK
jgi:hypothetical protein